MAPKKKFSKQQIVDAGLEIAKTEGIDHVTIRKVADQLECSIAPIYVNFKDVNELKQDVFNRIIELSNDILREQDSGRPFYDMGVASLRFARDYRVLFRDLVMKPNEFMKDYDEDMGSDLIEHMKNDADLTGLTDSDLKLILLKMRVFSLGLSTMVANGLLPEDFSEEQEMELLRHTAEDVIRSAHRRKGNV